MKMFGILAVLALASAVFAATSVLGGVQDATSELCVGLRTMLPVVAMLMIILAGVIYAAGQMMGAETRARTSGSARGSAASRRTRARTAHTNQTFASSATATATK